jgi:hypothetical protein
MARVWPELFAYQFILEAEIETLDDDATSASLESGEASSHEPSA